MDYFRNFRFEDIEKEIEELSLELSQTEMLDLVKELIIRFESQTEDFVSDDIYFELHNESYTYLYLNIFHNYFSKNINILDMLNEKMENMVLSDIFKYFINLLFKADYEYSFMFSKTKFFNLVHIDNVNLNKDYPYFDGNYHQISRDFLPPFEEFVHKSNIDYIPLLITLYVESMNRLSEIYESEIETDTERLEDEYQANLNYEDVGYREPCPVCDSSPCMCSDPQHNWD